jgi:hypothetical protein
MEDVHQQQLGSELRGRDLVLEEPLETGFESCAELHGGKQWSVVSKQSAVGRRKKAIQNSKFEIAPASRPVYLTDH